MALPLSEQDEQEPEESIRAGYAQLIDVHAPNEPAESRDGPSDTERRGYVEAASQIEVDGSRGPNRLISAVNGGTVVSINGVEFHVYGNAGGLELLGTNGLTGDNELDIIDSDEEEEDEMQRVQAETAIREANAADAARRSAPLPPDRCSAIKNAMRGISLGGFRPDWADSVPEEQWISGLKRRLE